MLVEMDLTIRPAIPGDADPVAGLMTQLGYPTDGLQMARRMSELAGDPGTTAFVAELDTMVVGMIGLLLHRGYEYDGCMGEIINLVVDEAHRGHGIGAALVIAGEAWLRERGVRRIKINTSHRRVQTHGFYERMGYASTGLRFVKELA
jgi:GNAT superfamily N-acetyltransferase